MPTGHRYDLYEQVGCYPYIPNTALAFPLVLLWPIVVALGSVIYCGMSAGIMALGLCLTEIRRSCPVRSVGAQSAIHQEPDDILVAELCSVLWSSVRRNHSLTLRDASCHVRALLERNIANLSLGERRLHRVLSRRPISRSALEDPAQCSHLVRTQSVVCCTLRRPRLCLLGVHGRGPRDIWQGLRSSSFAGSSDVAREKLPMLHVRQWTSNIDAYTNATQQIRQGHGIRRVPASVLRVPR